MAILDVSLFNFFKPVFTLFFVFVFIYALLEKTKILGSNRETNALFAFVIGLLFILTPNASDLLNIMTPWFVIFFVFIIFIILMFLMVGVKEESVVNAFTSSGVVWTIVIIAVFFIFGVAVSQVFGPVIQGIYGTEETAREGITFDIGRIIFHPRMLGALFVLVVASQAVRLISKSF